VKPHRLNAQEWADLRLQYETSEGQPTLRQLADKHGVSRSTVFKRAARENWKQNAALVEATRKQIVQKIEAKMEAATTEAAHLVAKQVVDGLQPWIEQERADHIRRAVTMGRRGYERIEKLWDESEAVDVKEEQVASSALDKHDTVIRRNLGMSDRQDSAGSIDVNVLGSRRVLVAIDTDSTAAKSEEHPNIKTRDC
jgi:hypothetical protein